MLFLMWQITIFIIFITFEVHMTEASCDETQLSFSQNYDKGISPSGKILCLKNIGLVITDISVVQNFFRYLQMSLESTNLCYVPFISHFYFKLLMIFQLLHL